MLMQCDRLQPHHSQVVKVVLVVDPHILLVTLTLGAVHDVLHIGTFAVVECAFEQLEHQNHMQCQCNPSPEGSFPFTKHSLENHHNNKTLPLSVGYLLF